MTEEILYAGSLIDDDFLTLIKICHRANMFTDALVLIENFPNKAIKEKDRQGLLLFERFAPEIPFNKYTSGRIFTEQLELRWVRQGRQEMYVVYLGDAQYASVLNDYLLKDSATRSKPLKPDELKVNPKKFYFLFGERLSPGDRKKIGVAQAGNFAEARIPHLLQYPPPNWKDHGKVQEPDVVEKKPYMQLQVREYLDDMGNVVLFRFQCLKAAGGLRNESI